MNSAGNDGPRKTISARFRFALIGILSLILSLFTILATLSNAARISDELQQHLQRYLNISAASLALPITNSDVDTIAGVLDAVMLDENFVVARVVTDSVVSVQRNTSENVNKDFEQFDSSWKYISGSVPVVNNGEAIGTFELVFSRATANRHILLQMAFILFLVGLLISAILITSTRFTQHAITQPLSQLQRYAASIAEGDLDVSLDLRRDDEIGLLANELDDMRTSVSALVQKLQDTNNELELANKTLEDKVEKRTLSVNQAQQRLVDAIDSAADGVAIWDKEGHLLLSNQSYYEIMYDGNTSVAVPGMKFEEIVRVAAEKGIITSPSADIDAFVADRVAEHNNPGEPVMQVRRDDRAIQITKSRTKDGGIVSIYSDLTKLKEKEAQLAETVKELELARDQAMDATRAKSRFLANMSHELRTPLNAIIGYSELLHDEATDIGNKEFIPDLEKIRDAGKHLLNLINDVLDLSKIEAGKMTVHIEKFHIETLLNEVKSVIDPVLAQKGNSLEINISEDLDLMTSDLTKVRQNLFNLLSNAAKFTENGTITIDVFREIKNGDVPLVAFDIADSGIGMTAEQVDGLFEAFLQADSSISKNYGGTGLGLSITKQFCQLLGGDITVRSEPGLGSTFSILLPLNYVEPVGLSDSLTAGTQPVALNGYKLLLIDDDSKILEELTQIFNQEGYQVITAINGDEGLRLAREQQPDLITLDIVMPGIDGWSVLKTLKSDINVRHIPVVVMTLLGDRELGHTLGAVDYITKPIERDLVVETVERFRVINNMSRVLIIDDDANTRDVLKRTLRPIGCAIVEAENGPLALDAIAESPPTLILLDIMMPGMDGFELLERLRSEPAWNDIRVIIVSAKDLTERDLNWLNERVSEIFQKGRYNRQDLLGAVSNALGVSTTRTLSCDP